MNESQNKKIRRASQLFGQLTLDVIEKNQKVDKI